MNRKIVRFRLVSPSGGPLPWAKVSASLLPTYSYANNYNTVFPTSMTTKTNEYGIGELILYANDALDYPDSKYLITFEWDGKSVSFIVRITKDMPDVIDFEDLLDRNKLWQSLLCKQKPVGKTEDGNYIMFGEKLYI